MATNALLPGNKLPKKEQDSFKQLVTFYESKHYKKAVKLADQILAKFPTHGETLAMKGLVVNSMGKKDEAYELVKLGVKNDIRSSVCWHVYGLIYKSDNNFKESTKCFMQALKLDPTNQNIMRDLSFLQLQLKDYTGFLASRSKILEARPSLRASWVAFGVANYLAKDYQRAFEILAKTEEGIFETPAEPESESEIFMFQALCLEKLEKFDEVFAHLNKYESKILDKIFLRRKRAELLAMTGKFAESLEIWVDLITEQSDNYRFHCGAQTALLELDSATCASMFALRKLDLPCTVLALSAEQKAKLLEFYQSKAFKSRAVPKISMFIVEGEALKARLSEHMEKCIRSEIPALYQDICSLIRTPSPSNPNTMVVTKEWEAVKAHPVTIAALQILDGFISNLKQSSTFHGNAEGKKEVPSALLWALFLQAHLFEISGRLDEALAVIEACIEHTPTALDMLLKKARILKQKGEFQLAAQVANECRALDLQDRFLNNKTTKYMLRANQIESAQRTIAMFVKNEDDSEEHLHDMQVNWYLTESADAYQRVGKFGDALLKYSSVKKHFNDYIEDMYDFHQYVFRKSTLLYYMGTLEFHEREHANKYFQRSFMGATSILLKFIADPALLAAAKESAVASETAAKATATPAKTGGDEDKEKVKN